MRKNNGKNKISTAKLGVLFIATAMALAAIGAGYSAFFDAIAIDGSVSTGSIDWTLEWVSGTWVYKVPGEANEIIVQHQGMLAPGERPTPPDDFIPRDETENCIAFSEAYAFDEPTDTLYITWDSLFPEVHFYIDLLWHYTGSVPAKVSEIEFLPDAETDPLIEDIFEGAIMVRADQFGDPVNDLGDPIDPSMDPILVIETYPDLLQIVDICTQLHYCDYVYCVAGFYVPQEDQYMDISGGGTLTIELMQWNEVDCEEEECDADIGVIKEVDNSEPPIGSQITYTVTTTNHGSCDATGIVIEDVLPNGVTYVSDTGGGAYDPGTGLWTVGGLLNGASTSLDITVTVEAGTTTSEFTQLAMVLDGSGSIGTSDFNIMKNGLATAIEDYVPHNALVELTVIHFAGTYANVEVGPIILTDDPLDPGYYMDIADDVRAITYRGGYTPLACGLYLTADTLAGSSYYDPDHRQVINIVTDGVPNVVSNPYPDKYNGVHPSDDDEALGMADAEIAMAYLLSTLALTSDGVSFGQDEVDVEAIDFPTAAYDWLKDNIVWPQPADENWPPLAPGWIRSINTYEDFTSAIKEKFQLVFESIQNCAEVIASTPIDPNPTNNKACIVISPQPS